MSYKLKLLIGMALSASVVYSGETVWKKDSPTNPLVEGLGKTRFEAATGSRVFLIDEDWTPPKNPTQVKGTVLHYDATEDDGADTRFVMGDKNPIQDWERLKIRLYARLKKEGIKNINDKWDEYLFLKLVAPDIAPPETHLLSEYAEHRISPETFSQLELQADQTMQKFKLVGAEVKEKLIRLEMIRQSLQPMGRAILKERVSCHSEGRLPKSDDNWMEIYAGYQAVTIPEMDRVEKEMANSSGSVKDVIVKLPFYEGKVLEAILETPDEIVAQKMLKIHREVRVHIMDGKLMHPNASFLRFYKLNEYLPEDERKLIYEAVQKRFLSQLGPKLGKDLKKMYATADVVITDTGEISIIDFNEGFDSGYYLERNDIFTANYQSQFFNGGSRTPLLEEYHRMAQLPIGHLSSQEMRRMLAKYRPFIYGLTKKDRKYIDEEVERAFWDRMIIAYMKKLERHPTPEMFDRALADFRHAGLRNPNVYLQFLNQVQDTVKEKNTQRPLRLNPDRAHFWTEYVSNRALHLEIHNVDTRIYGSKKPQPKSDKSCTGVLGKLDS